MGFTTANYDDRTKDAGYQNYSRMRKETDAYNQAQGQSLGGSAFGDTFNDWLQYQHDYGDMAGGAGGGAGGGEGGAGGSGTPVSTDPLKQQVMQGLQAAGGASEPGVTGFQELPGPGAANPSLGSRIYPQGQPRLALLPRAY